MSVLFRKISPGTTRLQSLFHRHVRNLAFVVEGREWRADAPPSGGTPHEATLYGTLGDGEVAVWLNSPDWRVAAASVLEIRPEEVAGLPEAVRLAALECFASGLFGAIEQATGLPAALTRMEMGEASPPASACPFAVTDADGLRVSGAWTAGSAGDWIGAVEKALAALPVPRRPAPESLPLAAEVALGTWSAPQGALEGLEAGDVVLSPAGPERTFTVGGKYRFAARLHEGVLSVDGNTMTDATEPLEKLDDVQVELQARVGTLSISLGDLRALGEGQVVEFSTPVESPATLTVNGRPVARGELLDVGGRVGVRITALVE